MSIFRARQKHKTDAKRLFRKEERGGTLDRLTGVKGGKNEQHKAQANNGGKWNSERTKFKQKSLGREKRVRKKSASTRKTRCRLAKGQGCRTAAMQKERSDQTHALLKRHQQRKPHTGPACMPIQKSIQETMGRPRY